VGILLLASPVRAARPLLDQPQWDRYFALSARDVMLPWQPATVRLATYSGAPVDFAVYNIDPAEVIVAGQNRPARAIDTSRMKPIARWRFTPPPGYRFDVSDVGVPLGSQEGFYVVEAHRGDATQQVWLNRTRIGLVTKESPEGLLVWCVDLGSGRALKGANVAFLVGQELETKQTDARGLIEWDEHARPSFALADYGASRAFVSLLPQAPLPQTIVGLRLESASVRSGDVVQFVGFVRHRISGDYHRATGDVHVTLVGNGRTQASTTAHLDAAGAFSGQLAIPADAASGDDAVLASTAGGVGGTSVHVDAATAVTLEIHANCPCPPERAVELVISARRGTAAAGNLPLSLRVIRTPHIVPPGVAEDAQRWGTTVVLEQDLSTDEQGRVRVALPVPADGLGSTYGVFAGTGGATANVRIAVPTAPVALAVDPEVAVVAPGEPVAFDVRGFDAVSGAPRAGLAVKVTLAHGPVSQEQDVTLDERGQARATFTQASLGTNLAFAQATIDGARALDVSSMTVDPTAVQDAAAASSATFSLSLDRGRYRPGDRIVVTANLPGAVGDALVTIEGARTYDARLTRIVNGRAGAALTLGDVCGDVRVGVAAVDNGAVALGETPLAVDGPGHALVTAISLDASSFSPGERAHVLLHDGGATSATVAVRIADGRESEPAYLDDVPDVLRVGGTTTQNPASQNPAWHAFVAPAGSNAADVYAAERPRAQATQDLTLGAAATPHTYLWRIARSPGGVPDVVVPLSPGHYVLSVLKIADDGDVGADSLDLDVR
jgi:hypothetical protein